MKRILFFALFAIVLFLNSHVYSDDVVLKPPTGLSISMELKVGGEIEIYVGTEDSELTMLRTTIRYAGVAGKRAVIQHTEPFGKLSTEFVEDKVKAGIKYSLEKGWSIKILNFDEKGLTFSLYGPGKRFETLVITDYGKGLYRFYRPKKE
jgi:hypothetical protein